LAILFNAAHFPGFIIDVRKVDLFFVPETERNEVVSIIIIKSNILTLYHGTRSRFDVFDPAFFKTGEGDADYYGWYFCRTLKGALWHCESYLRCDVRNSEGFILECQVEAGFTDKDIEGHFTEPKYDRPIYGLSLAYSNKIKVVRILSAKAVFESIYGKIVEVPNY
jgi:hypothetical protein